MKDRTPIKTDDLAVELHKDITRAELALDFRSIVLTPLHTDTAFQAKCRGAYSHMAVSTLNLAFMTLARLFDSPKGRSPITLELLISRILDQNGTNQRVKRDAEEHLKKIRAVRRQLSDLRNNAFAHRNGSGDRVLSWEELESVRDCAKKIMEWCGSERGQAYFFSRHLRGYRAECRRMRESLQCGSSNIAAG